MPTPLHSVSYPARGASRLAGSLLHRMYHRRDSPHYLRERPPLTDVQRTDSFHRAALLSFYRRQDREVPRQRVSTSSFSNPKG